MSNSKYEHWLKRQENSRQNRDDHAAMLERIQELDKALPRDTSLVTETFEKFKQLPISNWTLVGLDRGNYSRMTAIQAEGLPHALTGRDILGAAKTGSGKTLAFVIPVLEKLYLEQWDDHAGMGALILTPTRELALQIFKVLQVVGIKHKFSAALLTGGRNVDSERKRLHAINIVVGTPGRVLQHLSEDSELTADNLKILVMDEADRLLDMGFKESITAIIEHVPKAGCQTLLFSATQTTNVSALAQLSLKDPVYVAAHAMSLAPTPSKMCQNFIVLELERKLDALLMFLKRHPHDKIVVFVSTCNQAKYMYLAFSKIIKKMRIPAMCLTGKMKQFRRDEVFMTFCRCKSAVMFCTDLAARGLDFPMVHWVLQFDCPDSVQTYIHRAGRTARAGARGACIMFMTPRETKMLPHFHAKQIPLREIQIRSHLMSESKEIFVALVVQGLKFEAQKALISYLRSVHFGNKEIFDLESIDVAKFAHSLGLLVVPDMSEVELRRSAKNLPWDIVNYLNKAKKTDKSISRRERHLGASDMFREMDKRQRYAPGAESEDEDIFVKKPAESTTVAEEALTAEERMAGLSKHKKREILKKADLRIKDLGLSKRTVFEAAEEEEEQEPEEDVASNSEGDEAYTDALRQRVANSKAEDKERLKALKKKRAAAKKQKADEAAGKFVGGDSGSDSEESLEFDEDMQKLLRAARGEGVSESESEEEEEEEEAPAKRKRHE